MFNKLKRYYNQNRKKIWSIIGICVFIIILIQTANYLAGLSLKNKGEKKKNAVTKDEIQTESIISESKVSETVAKNNNNAIDEFVQFCNDGKIDSAYAMLTADCKEALYNSLEDFEKFYYNKIFNEKKLYTKENWYSDKDMVTYRITYTNNILADGGVKSEETFGDYITVINNNGKYELNIGQFINKRNLDKTYEDDNIKIEVESAQIFRLYEIYKIKFYNKTNGEINIYDTQVNADADWHIEDKNKTESKVAIGEAPASYLKIESGMTQTINAKFTKTYNPEKTTKKILLENIKIGNDIKTVEINL